MFLVTISVVFALKASILKYADLISVIYTSEIFFKV